MWFDELIVSSEPIAPAPGLNVSRGPMPIRARRFDCRRGADAPILGAAVCRDPYCRVARDRRDRYRLAVGGPNTSIPSDSIFVAMPSSMARRPEIHSTALQEVRMMMSITCSASAGIAQSR